MFHCVLVCASSFLRKFVAPADGIPPLGDNNADSSLRAHYVVGSTPARNPYFAAGIFPSQSQDHNSADEISPTRKLS